MRRASPPKGADGEGSFTLNPTASPKQITIKGLSDKNSATDGIYRFEDGRLILCMGGASDSRPTEFSSKGAKNLSLIVYERDAVEPTADEKQLQGKWQAVEGQFGGVKLTALEVKAAQLTITGDRIRIPLPPKGFIRDCQFVLNTTASPKQITIKQSMDPRQNIEGIYTFDGDRLYLCLAGEMRRPEGFSSRVGTSLLLFAFERESRAGAKSIELTPPKVLPHIVGSWSVDLDQQIGPRWQGPWKISRTHGR